MSHPAFGDFIVKFNGQNSFLLPLLPPIFPPCPSLALLNNPNFVVQSLISQSSAVLAVLSISITIIFPNHRILGFVSVAMLFIVPGPIIAGGESKKMGSRMKEEERIERIIRSLLKLPDNRRCINCNILGPQYVCTTFWTFVCTNCSGIHREFTHRVKSVSLAKFTTEEVNALQAGGNEKAKQIYFKEWNPQRHSFPDSCNIHRLRDFIKHVYVERKYTGEKSSDNLPRLQLNDKDESNKSRTINALRLESKSPHYEERREQCYSGRSGADLRSDDRSFKYYYDERKSPRCVQHLGYGGHNRSPIKFEVVDDRFQDNESRTRRLSSLESKLKRLSPDVQNNVDQSQSPVACTVGEVIGKNVPTLQKDASSGGDGSVEENPAEQKNNNPESLIDLSTESQAFDPVSGSNWDPFEASKSEKDPQTPNTDTLKSSTSPTTPQPAKTNSLESLLFELSGPMFATTGGVSQVSSCYNVPSAATVENMSAGGDSPPIKVRQITASRNNADAFPLSSTATELVQASNEVHPHPSNGVPPQTELYSRDNSLKVSHGHQITSMHILHPCSSIGCSSMTQSTSPPIRPVPLNNQPLAAPNTHDPLNAFSDLSSQTTTKPAQCTRSDVAAQPGPARTMSSGRMELPADLFSTSYLSGPAPLAGWLNVQPYGMGFGVQYYPTAAPLSAFPVAAESTNPFEVTGGRTQIYASPNPRMACLQGVLPAATTRTGLSRASSLGSSGLMVPQFPSYGSPMAPQSPFACVIPTGPSFEQENNDMQHSRPQRVGSFNGDRTSFGLASMQQSAGGYMLPSTPNNFSKTGGNPFEF